MFKGEKIVGGCVAIFYLRLFRFCLRSGAGIVIALWGGLAPFNSSTWLLVCLALLRCAWSLEFHWAVLNVCKRMDFKGRVRKTGFSHKRDFWPHFKRRRPLFNQMAWTLKIGHIFAQIESITTRSTLTAPTPVAHGRKHLWTINIFLTSNRHQFTPTRFFHQLLRNKYSSPVFLEINILTLFSLLPVLLKSVSCQVLFFADFD